MFVPGERWTFVLKVVDKIRQIEGVIVGYSETGGTVVLTVDGGETMVISLRSGAFISASLRRQ